MAFKAVFLVDDKELRVLHCNFSISRSVDFNGRPSSEPQGGTMHVEVESTDSTLFVEWIINPYMMKSGSVKFYKRDDKATLKEVKFTDAYLISYGENFTNTGDSPMTESLVFSAKELTVEGDGSAGLVNEWPI
jgi:Hemolysin coregulated protein Hcp (TssD)